tara:strand:+ start:303 stop:443 length:141 start_codon:yes stop_codon:yes gene_type:complete
METKTIKLETDNNLENVILLPCKPSSEKWVFVEFPYKHLLPVVEAA